ncbi:UbiA family prenyltransferase [Streptomyces sp. bgisy153]|uniref:UbiA family prenyltransferase n=1 Tax=Streptomyces sp. bgisy153 TaxID=3413793 RepID=UPI003D7102BF
MPMVTTWPLSVGAPRDLISGIPRTALDCLRETRPAVLAAFQLRYLAGIALAIGSGPIAGARPVLQGVLGSLAWFCAILYTYLYNGCTDYHEDRINGSTRPIACGRLSRRTALAVVRCAACAALVFAAGAGPGPLLLCVALLGLGYGYSAPRTLWKNRTPAAMAVVLGSGLLTYCAGPLAVGVSPTSPALLLTASAMSLWMALVGAVVKDLSDIAGDAAAGRRTWAVTLGERRTRGLAALGACLVGGGFTAGAALWAPRLLPTAGVVLTGAVVLAAVVLTARPGDSRSRRRRPYRVFMTTQHLAHLFLLAHAVA